MTPVAWLLLVTFAVASIVLGTVVGRRIRWARDTQTRERTKR